MIFITCRTSVNSGDISRKNINGVEHIVISSATLPDDIVMNGGLYPAEEIEKSFESLDMTLAPIEHPVIDGQFISANDPRAIHDFHAGAFNTNVRRESGKVYIDKTINVAEALKTDRGKRLLDRINNIEDQPIHTSVAAFLDPEEATGTNAAGQEYSWIARNMVFDHDAILLDSEGAATPEQGVGIAVNREGVECKTSHFSLDRKQAAPGFYANQLSFSELSQLVAEALGNRADWIDELYEDRVVYWSKESLFEDLYTYDEEAGKVTIAGAPVEVRRVVSYKLKSNHHETNDMKELIINELKKAGVDVEKMSDEQLMKAYKLLCSKKEPDPKEETETDSQQTEVAKVVANALVPMAEQIAKIQNQIDSEGKAEAESMVEIITNSGKYPALDEATLKLLPNEKLKELAGKCRPAYGLPPMTGDTDKIEDVPTEMIQ